MLLVNAYYVHFVSSSCMYFSSSCRGSIHRTSTTRKRFVQHHHAMPSPIVYRSGSKRRSRKARSAGANCAKKSTQKSKRFMTQGRVYFPIFMMSLTLNRGFAMAGRTMTEAEKKRHEINFMYEPPPGYVGTKMMVDFH